MAEPPDDPIDLLEYHRQIATDDSIDIEVAPSWRPTKFSQNRTGRLCRLPGKLEAAADVARPLRRFYVSAHCRPVLILPPAAAARPIMALNAAICAGARRRSLDAILGKRLAGETLSELEIAQQFTAGGAGLLGRQYARVSDAAIIIGAIRTIISGYLACQPDTGFDPLAIITLAGRSPVCSTVWM